MLLSFHIHLGGTKIDLNNRGDVESSISPEKR